MACTTDGVQGAGDRPDAYLWIPADAAGDARSGEPADAHVGPDATPAICDMTGRWLVISVVLAEALSAVQTGVYWQYYDITHDAPGSEAFTIVGGLSCGFRSTGTTTVTLPESGLAAMATKVSTVGRRGTIRSRGGKCEYALERTYTIIGANDATYLSNYWQPGDAAIDLSDLPLLPEGPGMEDWDADAKDGITYSTGYGPRYLASRAWNEHIGTAPSDSDEFGGPGAVKFYWDQQESVSEQTAPILRTHASVLDGGYVRYIRVGESLEVTGDALETCRNVQRLALEGWPNP